MTTNTTCEFEGEQDLILSRLGYWAGGTASVRVVGRDRKVRKPRRGVVPFWGEGSWSKHEVPGDLSESLGFAVFTFGEQRPDCPDLYSSRAILLLDNENDLPEVDLDEYYVASAGVELQGSLAVSARVSPGREQDFDTACESAPLHLAGDALIWILKQNREVRVSEVADHFEIEYFSAKDIVDYLLEQGLLEY